MEYIFVLLLVFAFGFVFFLGIVYGWHVHERYLDRKMNQVMRAIHEDINENVIHINIERHGDMTYIYDKETKQFMAQGKTREELETILHEKFPGKKFAASETEIRDGLRDA